MNETGSREQWATRMGFILAAVGSAVGLGNVWRFPFQVGENGGASFLLIYLFLILLIGVPAMLVEFSIGRRSQRNPVDAFKKLGYGGWSFVGVICVLAGFVILAFYSVVAGWTIDYTIASATGAYFDDAGAYFGSINEGPRALLFHAIFMGIVVGIVAFGIQKGIELSVKILVPAIIVLLVGLMIYGLSLDNAMEGVRYYLSPDFDVMRNEWTTLLPAAAGQAFFTLSLGMGAMITYSSYLGKNDSMAVDSGWIVGFDTGIAVLVGLVIFPVLFAVGMDPGEPGAGALFVGLGEAISEAPASRIIGVLFFGTVAIAAISSGISILEVVVSFIIDHFEVGRVPAALGVGAVIFAAGAPVAFSLDILGVYDTIASKLLLPVGMGLMVLFAGWIYREAADEVGKGMKLIGGWFPIAWLWHVRTVILVVIALTIVLNAMEAFEFFREM